MDLNSLDQLYRSATDASTGVSFTDGDGIVVHVNTTFCRMTGYEREDFLGKRHDEIFTDLDQSIDQERLARHFYHHSQWRGEIRLRHHNGTEVWTDTTILPLFNAEGGLDGLFTLSLDVTEKKRIERELGNNQQKLGFVLDSLQTAFWEWDARTDSAWFNDNWPRMLGYELHEVPKNFHGWADFVHPEDKERATQEMLFHVKNKTPALVSLQRFRHKNGKWVHVMTKGRVVERDENGRAVRFIGVNHDLSAVNRLEQLSFHIQDLAGIGVWDVDLGDGVPHWSLKVYEIFGLDPNDKPKYALSTTKLIHPLYRERITTAFDRLCREGIPYDLEIALVNERWIRVAGRVESFEGKPYRAFGIIQDINERKMAEEVLRTSQETLQLALDAGNFGVWDWDIPSDQAYWSPTMRELFGQPPDRTEFSFEYFKQAIDPEDIDQVMQVYHESINGRSRSDATFRIVNNGTKRWVRSIGTIERDHDNKPMRMIGVCWDVSQQMEIQQVQARAIEEAQNAINMKSQFMATVSHEIRTPMSGVIGMTEILSETQLNAEQREIVQTIKICGENLLNLVNDILDYSKLEANKVDLVIRPFRLQDTIKNTLDLFQYSARQKNITLSYHIAPSVPEVIQQDEARLYQILFNLVGNAVKFTQRGSVSIEVEGANDQLYFRVKDSGMGIPQESFESIFESFIQLNPGSTQGETAGTGLGLSIVRSLVQLMGGQIKVNSTLGKGSTFNFNVHAPAASAVHAKEVVSAPKTFKSLEYLNVLVVEDNPINLKLMVSILERLKISVEVAENGLTAIEKVQRNSYDLIFMDIQMPHLDGIEATKKIRAMNLPKRPTIIALTANVTSEHRRICLNAGMDDFLSKPIRVQTIRSQLNFYASRIMPDPELTSTFAPYQNKKLLDRELLMREFSGFEDLLQEFCQIFLANYSSYLQEIETSLTENDLQKTYASAHAFKGVLSNLHSDYVFKLLEQLENLAQSNNKKACEQCFVDVTKVIGQLVKEVEEISKTI